jgi:allophanate hydrolase subunit 1
MGRLRYEYRYDIALALITETSAVEYDDVKWAKQELAKHLSKLAQEKKIKEQKEFNAVILQALNGDRVAN